MTFALIASLVGATGACGGEDDKEDITIALVSPTTGALEAVGLSFQRVAEAAVGEINDRGGVDGHMLVLETYDSETNKDRAREVLQSAIDLDGVVGAVGPATSDAVGECAMVAKTEMVPIVSPSSTAPSLAMADDDGYMFRNVPNDDIQGIAMAYYLTEVADPAVTSATLVYEDTSYGRGLADAFEAAFECNGGTVDGRITFVQNIGMTGADDVVADLVTAAPSMAVMVALEQDGALIVDRWDADGNLPDMEWFMTDGLRSAGFLDGLPASMENMLGTAPTFPTLGDAYSVLEEAYDELYPDEDLSEEVFAPNVWDGVYLLAAALMAQKSDSEFDGVFGGALLRDKLTEISKGPGPVIHAGQWRDLTSAIKAGNPVDYDGASGPNDFDENGEAVGPYEVWQLVDDGDGALTFQRVLFLEARDIEMLLGGACN
jgi:ABC-type branched-subunit amino acid transport system substrate-binding protein